MANRILFLFSRQIQSGIRSDSALSLLPLSYCAYELNRQKSAAFAVGVSFLGKQRTTASHSRRLSCLYRNRRRQNYKLRDQPAVVAWPGFPKISPSRDL